MTTPSPAARPDAIRRHNLALVLDNIHRDGALTRAELTQRLGVSRSTVGALVADLTGLGVLDEMVPTGGAGVGRPSHLVAPRDDGPFVVAVDVDVTHVVVAAIGIGGAVLDRALVDTSGIDPTPDTICRTIVETIPRLYARGRIVGIGVSVPGTVDRRTGRIGVAPNLGWRDAALGDLLAAAVRPAVPVAIGNDADLAVLAEHRRGGARDCDDVVYLMGRFGVGAGIIMDGAPLRGHDGHAGEFGHTVVESGGPPCHCGKNGCVETFVGDGALLALAGRASERNDAAVAAVFAAARAGDEVALHAVRTVAAALGRAAATMVNTLNPQRILLGGTLAQVLDLARPEIERALEYFAFEKRPVELAHSALGVDAVLHGAAEIAFAPLLADPLAGHDVGVG